MKSIPNNILYECLKALTIFALCSPEKVFMQAISQDLLQSVYAIGSQLLKDNISKTKLNMISKRVLLIIS